MQKAEILEKLKVAIIELDEDEVYRLIDEGMGAGLEPISIIQEGLSPGLAVIGDGFQKQERFTADLVIAGEIMTESMEKIRPAIEAGSGPALETMVIGTIEGDQHNIGKRIVAAVFIGAGYRVVDIGENQPASEFAKAAKELNASIVGASAILGPLKPYCKVVNEALIEGGIRNDLLFIIGGWGMTQDWCESVGADCYGDDAQDALRKVRMIKSGELPRRYGKS
ncbi:B12-binding domain-containing protein [Chloroflexota bacterium]